MASKIEFVEFVCDQLSEAGNISYKKMFGEYGIYMDGKFIAAVCDNQFFVKITEAGRKVLPEPVEAEMYEGSNLAFLIEDVENRDLLNNLLKATWSELPFPKPKKPKKR
ncbi:MAG TPA: TfoX/Sxy family protein [Candidatus Cloacimonadota bacterium]|jgi:TfoX/Sxy family transcriptional regulator of competence genes|nr:TfoX/Sxy family protein [Candidatus Cloacimonadota bacterium]